MFFLILFNKNNNNKLKEIILFTLTNVLKFILYSFIYLNLYSFRSLLIHIIK